MRLELNDYIFQLSSLEWNHYSLISIVQVYASLDIYEVKTCPHKYIAMNIRKSFYQICELFLLFISLFYLSWIVFVKVTSKTFNCKENKSTKRLNGNLKSHIIHGVIYFNDIAIKTALYRIHHKTRIKPADNWILQQIKQIHFLSSMKRSFLVMVSIRTIHTN